MMMMFLSINEGLAKKYAAIGEIDGLLLIV